MSINRKLRIGTRQSKLAIKQTREFIDSYQKLGLEFDYEIIPIMTKGDQVHHKPLRELTDGGKEAFTSELQDALINNEIDIAVHSMKDVAGNEKRKDLCFPAFLKRKSPYDVIISKEKIEDIEDLPQDYVIGTVSLRRKAALLRKNDKIVVKNLRGSIETRIAKLRGTHKWKGHGAIEYDAIIMAEAALERSYDFLDTKNLFIKPLNENIMIPASCQGVIGIECRRKDRDIRKFCAYVNDTNTQKCVKFERAFLYHLNGNCHTVIGVNSKYERGMVSATVETSSVDGTKIHEANMKAIGINIRNQAKKSARKFIKQIIAENDVEYLNKELNLYPR